MRRSSTQRRNWPVLGLGTAQRNIAAALVVGGQNFTDPNVVVIVISALHRRHRTIEFRKFPPTIDAAVPELTRQLIERGDHHSVHAVEHDIRAWVAAYTTPTPSSGQDRRPDPPIHPPINEAN